MTRNGVGCRVVQGECKLSHEAVLCKVCTGPTPPYTFRHLCRSERYVRSWQEDKR